MSAIVSTHEAKTQLSRLLTRVAAGEEIVIARSGKPIARLVAVSQPKKTIRTGGLAGKLRMSPDWDSADEDMISLFENSKIFPDT